MNTTTSLKECIAPNFYGLHRELKEDTLTELWLKGGRGCFYGDQLIKTSNGSIKIKDLTTGILVPSVNENTSIIELKPIVDTFTYENTKETFEVTLKNGEVITATGDHKFFQVGGCVSLKHMLYLTCKKNRGNVYVRRMEDNTELFKIRNFNRRKDSFSELPDERWTERDHKSFKALSCKGWLPANDVEGRLKEVPQLESSQMDGSNIPWAQPWKWLRSKSYRWDEDKQCNRKLGIGNTIREYVTCCKTWITSCEERGGLQLFKAENRAGDRDKKNCKGKRKVLQQKTVSRAIWSNSKLYKRRSNTKTKLLERLLDIKDIVSFRLVNIEKVYDLSVLDNHNYMLDIGEGVLVHNSTKSSFGSIEVILGIMKNPDAHAVGFRRFENEIRDSVFAQLEWATYKLGVNHLFRFNISPFKITYIPTGQMILFKGADNPKKIKSIKIPFGYIKWCWFEECAQFGGMLEIRNIIQSIFRGTIENQIAMFSYNPPKSARSWVNVEVKIHKEGRVVHSSDYREVPKEWLGETFLANAEHLKNINEDAYKHEYLGEETGTGLEVFKNVKLRPITDKEISYFDHRSQGIDFGYAADPLAFIEAHFDAKKKALYIFFEISGIGIKNSKFASMLSAEQLVEVTMADSAEPKSIDELREDHHMNIIAAEKAPGSVDHGIKFLQDLEQIIIDPKRCPLAATEFVNYALDVNRFGETISKYPDKNNHVLDCVRYLLSLQIKQAKIEKRKNKFKIRNIPTVSRW